MEKSSDEYDAVAQGVLGSKGGQADISNDISPPGQGRGNYFYLFFLVVLLGVIIAASFYLEYSAPVKVPSAGCVDGTPLSKCSATMPFYCMNGNLVKRASLCGCPDDYAVNGSGCVRVYRCVDGTLYGRCSDKPPFFCSMGELIPKASACGCPVDYLKKGVDCEKIRRCRDGTVYGNCSENKPIYCNEGLLVNDSQKCGCPEGFVALEDNCVSPYGGSPGVRLFPYTLRGTSSALPLSVHEGLKKYLSDLPRVYYCDPKCPTPQQLEMRYLADEKQKPELLALVEKIRKLSDDPSDQARIAISLVQNIPYDTESAEAGNLTNRYPYEVLFDQKGVCGEKSRLLAFILREMGYGVYLLDYENEEHMAVALKCPIEYAQYSYNKTGYCFLETTRVSILTDNTGEYSSEGGRLETVPDLLTVSDGKEFLPEEEYADAQDWVILNDRAASSGGILGQEDYKRWKEIKDRYGIPTLKSGNNT
ncbi:MAG: transglutaminase-like domain-containing protein [Candidatus Altiarchaeia archaeon]